jgi:hypothetical protein
MASQFEFPNHDLIGSVMVNMEDFPGSAHIPSRSRGYATKIVDAGTMTGDPTKTRYICEDGQCGAITDLPGGVRIHRYSKE